MMMDCKPIMMMPQTMHAHHFQNDAQLQVNQNQNQNHNQNHNHNQIQNQNQYHNQQPIRQQIAHYTSVQVPISISSTNSNQNPNQSQNQNLNHNQSRQGSLMMNPNQHYQPQQMNGAQVYQTHQLVMAPPTPPSEENASPTYLTNGLNGEQLQYSQLASGSTANNQPIYVIQSNNTSNGNLLYTNSCQQQHQQPSTISSYYYDIDDEFSDILSAPPTPEPQNCAHHLNVSMNHNQLTFNQTQSSGGDQHLQQGDQFNCYLPYKQHTNHQVYDTSYVMSPDSSSLSTSLSSPGDHSMYQSNMSSHLLNNQVNLQHQHHQQQMAELSPVSLCDTGSPEQCGHLTALGNELGQQPLQTKLLNKKTQLSETNKHMILGANGQQHRSAPIHLWEFLKELLQQVDSGNVDAAVIRWLDRQKGVFKIEDSVRVAKLWGKRKNKPKMNYDKLSRSIRQYYKKGIMKKTDRSQRLVYQFCSAYSL